jgi:hypothetical protein
MRVMSLIRKQPYIRMFTKKRSNKGAVWASLLSLGATAVVWGMTKGKKSEKKSVPLRNMFTNMMGNKNFTNMSNTALTEFSDELVNNVLKKKQ